MLTRAYNHRTCNLLDSREEVPFRGHLYYSRMGTQLFYRPGTPPQQKPGERFHCSNCSKSYKYKRDLVRHQRLGCNHRFDCHLCSFKTLYRTNLNIHCYRRHNIPWI
ncbi:longitudinals lacking protein, isoforms F/I/K/T-like isoform X2 [Homalodisca vitripennis]|uniref:longitudinals lacking protein, isoforms F/I/K/T-like isoform X1 n=1 Tax=Homalodisca vitripennis TaxID=197043 RepID=UPI001EEC8EAB|nr:longitudinals lacking protein, isoforms F/I/K/T-like isoform X1 [Homalodisca vitripennis]XP_046663220.1 longitudinals lacking protein, isoforms F/I/K/T-like isoform X2 [Homalodisca vitripennis]